MRENAVKYCDQATGIGSCVKDRASEKKSFNWHTKLAKKVHKVGDIYQLFSCLRIPPISKSLSTTFLRNTYFVQLQLNLCYRSQLENNVCFSFILFCLKEQLQYEYNCTLKQIKTSEDGSSHLVKQIVLGVFHFRERALFTW